MLNDYNNKRFDGIKYRPINVIDLSFINEVRNECSDFLHDNRKFTLKETRDWYFTVCDNPNKYYIIFNDNNKIGYIRTSNYNSEDKSLYIGMDLHKNYRGKGLAYKTYMKFIPFIFNELDINDLFLEVLYTNERAIILYDKLGFNKIGIKIIKRNNENIESIVMKLKKNEFNEITS